MASKSTYASEEKGAEIEELLDVLDKLVDRVKVMYEQYFMGIQKQAPAHLHNDAERRLRDLAQLNIRNTALRYRFATLQQKFGAYNTYWKRTLREIEGGRYMRNLSKVRRQAQMTGEEIPEEILAKMPKRMREAVARDREVALAKAAREGRLKVTDQEATIDSPMPDSIVAGFDDDDVAPSDTQPDLAIPHSVLAKPMRGSDSHRLDDPFAGGAADEGDIADMLTALADEALAAVENKPAPPPPPVKKTPPPVPAVRHPTTPPPMAAVKQPSAGAVRRPPTDTMPSPPPRDAPAPRATTNPPTPGPRPAISRPPTQPAGSPIPGMSEADTRTLYAKYIKAREVVGEKSDPMSYDKLQRTLSSQAVKILEQHKASGVEFNVVIKDNKVVLKAKPK